MEQIKDIISSVIGQMAEKNATAPSLVDTWKRIAGINSRATEIKKDVLMVTVDSGARMMHLHNRKIEIIEALNKEFPQIKDIRFKVGMV